MTEAPQAHAGESLLILGAGLVGCAAALTFARQGFKVTVIDREGPGSGASHGNAGGVVPSASPLAQPNLPMQIPGMLLDRTSPLSVRPGQLIKELPWFLQFLRECTPHRSEENSKALYALSGKAAPSWKDLVRGTAAEQLLKDVGWLKVYSSEQGYRDHAPEREFLKRRNAQLEILSQDELRQMEPNLSKSFVKAMWQPDGLFCLNPRGLAEAVAAEAQNLGTQFLKEEAQEIAIQTDGRVALTTDQNTHVPDRLMLCAGAFSKRFAEALGGAPMLVAERGYHLMFNTPEKTLTRPTFWVEESLVVCPMANGVRLTSQSEFAGVDTPPDFRRIERLASKAAELLPGVNGEIRDKWMGRRPSTPDSLPYLGVAPATPRAYFNFGHNHLGLTLSAISAKVAFDDWTGAGAYPDIDLNGYRAIR